MSTSAAIPTSSPRPVKFDRAALGLAVGGGDDSACRGGGYGSAATAADAPTWAAERAVRSSIAVSPIGKGVARADVAALPLSDARRDRSERVLIDSTRTPSMSITRGSARHGSIIFLYGNTS